ncbi:MAG: hypothetical protein EOO48_02145 [Flavobacterium sp.]|nr:MAG: hypothetical protein EOO48_02145 [Flavobacterium sp.]
MKPISQFGLATALLLLISCTNKVETPTDYDLTDKVITLATTARTGQAVELPELYDQTVQNIPQDKDQNLIIAGKLQSRGFKQVAAARRDQQLSGRRMFVATMVKGDCQCEVSKVYYSTSNISQYFVAERIACQTIK